MREAASGADRSPPDRPPSPRADPWESHPGGSAARTKEAASDSTVPCASLCVTPQERPTAEHSATSTSPTCVGWAVT